MDERQALAAFAALGQEHRLRVVRALVTAGPDGLAAGVLAETVGVAGNNLSFHLKELSHAGLITSRREGKSIIYSAAYVGLSDLVNSSCATAARAIRRCAIRPWPLAACDCTTGAPPMPEPTYNVLFLCTGNSARSILAEAMRNKEGGGRFRAFSAGSQPKGEPHPLALKVLRESDYPTEGLRSKSWDEFAGPGAPVMDFVFTVCDNAAGEACPYWPGQPVTAHWGIEDPAAAEGSEMERKRAFVTAQRYLKNRIAAFVALPLGSLDQVALSSKVREIGQMAGATSARPEVA